jgi:hypothetical protein
VGRTNKQIYRAVVARACPDGKTRQQKTRRTARRVSQKIRQQERYFLAAAVQRTDQRGRMRMTDGIAPLSPSPEFALPFRLHVN